MKQLTGLFISRAYIIRLMGLLLLICPLFTLSCKTTPPPATNFTPTEPPVTTNSSTVAQLVIEVSIKGSAFTPQNIYGDQITTVIWTNNDTVVHTVTSDTGLFDFTLHPGGSFRYTFFHEGRYGYHCSNHPDMKGLFAVDEFD